MDEYHELRMKSWKVILEVVGKTFKVMHMILYFCCFILGKVDCLKYE